MILPSDNRTPPSALTRNILGVFGDRGRYWLETLPDLLDQCARRWSLRIGPPFELSYNYVAPATRADGTEVVLKAGVPNREMNTEIAALAAYNGRGAVRLLEYDADTGVALLERLTPGTMLSTVTDDDQATRIAAAVMRELRHSPPQDHPFPTVADWAKGLERLRKHYVGGTGPFPARLVEEAEALLKDLLASQGEPILLHGDLHHFNILLQMAPPSPQRWLAIDPKGVVGEAEYEIGAFLRNPDPEVLARPVAVSLQKRRIEIFAEELGFDRLRLRDWAVAQAVLSGWWVVEDHGEVSATWIACCERLAEVRF